MRYNVYLSGGGSSKETYEIDDLFFKKCGERILYLPVGLKRTFAGYDGCVSWFDELVSSHKLQKKIFVWIHLKDKALLINKNEIDAIYIGGASDTYRLHSMFIEHNIYPRLKEFIHQEGIIYGGSGGATVLGKTINYDQREKNLPYVPEEAANICNGYSVFTHFNNQDKKDIEVFEGDKLIALPEGGGCAIETDTNRIMFLGEKKGKLISD